MFPINGRRFVENYRILGAKDGNNKINIYRIGWREDKTDLHKPFQSWGQHRSVQTTSDIEKLREEK